MFASTLFNLRCNPNLHRASRKHATRGRKKNNPSNVSRTHRITVTGRGTGRWGEAGSGGEGERTQGRWYQPQEVKSSHSPYPFSPNLSSCKLLYIIYNYRDNIIFLSRWTMFCGSVVSFHFIVGSVRKVSLFRTSVVVG